MPGITLGVSDRSKLGGDKGSGQVLSGGSCEDDIYGKDEDIPLVDFLWAEFGTEIGPCDGRSAGRDVEKMEGSGER